MRDSVRALNLVYVALVGLYAAALGVVFSLQFLVVEPELSGLVRTTLALLLFPSPVLLVVALILRRWGAGLLMVVPVAGFLLSYGPLLLPRSSVQPDARTVTVLTFNLHGYRKDLGSLAAIIREADADVVGVQELSLEAAAYFETELADIYPHQSLHPQPIPYAGQGILSRYPVLADEYWRNEPLYPVGGHQRVELDLKGTRVIVYNTHPVPPFSAWRGIHPQPHSQEIAELLSRAGADSGPLILMGDFNMTEQFDDYRNVTSRYTDSFRAAGDLGFGFTFPAGRKFRGIPVPPLARLDYVFHNEFFQSLNARVWHQSGSSDHLPVWARLALVSRGTMLDT